MVVVAVGGGLSSDSHHGRLFIDTQKRECARCCRWPFARLIVRIVARIISSL
jgi:hypothetical protein